jgi:hypothetical protein
VDVRVLTKKLSADVRVLAVAFGKQHGSLEVRSTNAFHDRFLIIDGQDYYHFGASLKDAGGRGFMFSRIEEEVAIDALRSEIDAQWSAGSDLLA